MKSVHIFLIVILAISIGALTVVLGNTSTYADFSQATSNPDVEYHVVGKCDRDKETNYNPELNTDEFVFYMKDDKGIEKRVVLHKNKPQDFDRAEQIVIIGKMNGADFHAREILMKCPSKYDKGSPGQDGKS